MQKSEKQTYSGWMSCKGCHAMIHELEVCSHLHICPKCDFHMMLSADQRIHLLADEGSFEELYTDVEACDLLNFVDSVPYSERLGKARKKTGRNNGVIAGVCTVGGQKACIAVMDFAFMGGSLGRGEGEKITCLVEYATSQLLPVVIVSSSGGARMQESMYSLMQMAKTASALKRHQKKGCFYLSILTHPTMGGVSASYAFLGDVILAEPGALIGFAGPRVIEQTINEKLKSSDQKSEFQLKHGMIDGIVRRDDMKGKVSYFLKFFSKI